MDNWNDDRLGELSTRVDEGFKEMREGFARVDEEMKGLATKEEMKEGFAEMKEGLHRVNYRIDRIMYGFFASALGIFGALLVAVSRLT